MHELCKKLDELKSTSSNLDKTSLLKTFLQDDNFRFLVELTLDESMQYNIKQLPIIPTENKKRKSNFEELIEFLYFLSEKQGASKKEKEELSSFCINKYWERIIKCIISKNLGCGVASRMINKIEPGLLTIYPYMRYSDIEKLKHIKYPAYNQKKEDGLFINKFVNYANQSVKDRTRNGNEIILPEYGIENAILSIEFPFDPTETQVFMGEYRVKVRDKWLSRKKSNGIVNKALKKNQSITVSESEKIHFICWDIISEKEFWEGYCGTPYHERLEFVRFLNRSTSKRIHSSETKIVENFEDAKRWALELIEDGEEGTILKNMDSIWEDKPSGTNDGVKLKAGGIEENSDRECELLVTGWYYGATGKKYEKCLGGLLCESSDGKITVNIGGGFDDADRGFMGFDNKGNPIVIENAKEWIEETYLDKIVTVRFNEIIKKDNRETKSLFLPRFIEVREDKTKADNYEYIKNLKA